MKKIHLSLKEAITLAAVENFQRDQRMGLFETDKEIPPLEEYIEEARAVLTETGVNYDPEYPDHHLIYVKNNS